MGNNSWTHPAFFSRHLVPQNLRNIIFVCYFLNIGLGSKTNQCSSHFSKQSIPGLFYLEPHRKVNATTLELFTTNFKKQKQNRPTCFQTLTFCRNLGFQKPWICPWIFHRFSMDFPTHGFSGRPRERPTKNVGGCGGGGSPLPQH